MQPLRYFILLKLFVSISRDLSENHKTLIARFCTLQKQAIYVKK